MRVVVIAHGLWYGGAQAIILNYLSLLRNRVDLEVIVSRGCDQRFLKDLKEIQVPVHMAPHKIVNGYPDLVVENVGDVIKRADIAWISDVEYLTALRIKKLSDIPIVAHLHSYALICPWWDVSYGFQEACARSCRYNIRRYVSCRILRTHFFQWRFHRYSEIRKVLAVVRAPLAYFKWRSFFVKTIDNAIKDIDAFIAVSKAVKKIHLLHLPELRRKPFEVIYNPILIPREAIERSLAMEERTNIIMYSSGFSVVKGVHILLKAIREVSKEISDVRLVVTNVNEVGREMLSYVARKEGVDRFVDVVGYVPRDKLYELYSHSRAVIMPSVWPEPFGLVAAEANMLGVPVVASSIGGLPEIVEDGVTGYLVKPNDPHSLAEGIIRVFKSNFSREEIHKRTFRKFNPYITVENLLKFFKALSI